ncbi:MAG: hypothetical protein ACI9TP_002450 [Candidatus Azotimanducaceae bacterium]|jgi:hypothetical protein
MSASAVFNTINNLMPARSFREGQATQPVQEIPMRRRIKLKAPDIVNGLCLLLFLTITVTSMAS